MSNINTAWTKWLYIKKQLETPLMMGLWEPETCRVNKGNNTQNKELHPLVTLLQYVQKMHGINNLKKKRWDVIITPRPFYPLGKHSGTYDANGLVGPGEGLQVTGNKTHIGTGIWTLEFPIPSPVTEPTTKSRFQTRPEFRAINILVLWRSGKVLWWKVHLRSEAFTSVLVKTFVFRLSQQCRLANISWRFVLL